MKFVEGNAIAGIVVLAVSLVSRHLLKMTWVASSEAACSVHV